MWRVRRIKTKTFKRVDHLTSFDPSSQIPASGMRNVCLISGEASGDLQAALLVQELKKKALDSGIHLEIWGAGGAHLEAQGMELVADVSELNVMGFWDVAQSYIRLSPLFRKLRAELHRRKPQMVILVDYPGFNLLFAQEAAATGAFVAWHIAPKVWAHGSGRTEVLKRNVDVLTCLLPFEQSYFNSRGVPAVFVGNPLRDSVEAWRLKKESSRAEPIGGNGRNGRNGTSGTIEASEPAKPVEEAGAGDQVSPQPHLDIGILPGSRRSEVLALLPLQLQALAELQKECDIGLLPYRKVRACIPVASSLPAGFLKHIAERTLEKLNCSVELKFFSSTYDALGESHYAWVCSGTATLEAAFVGTPFSVLYKLSWLNYEIAKRIVRLPYVSLANLSAQEALVPEFIQGDCTLENLTAHAKLMLRDPQARSELRARLNALRDRFPLQSASLAADHIWSVWEESPHRDSTNAFSSHLKHSARQRQLYAP